MLQGQSSENQAIIAEEDLTKKILDIVKEIARRVQDPDKVKQLAEQIEPIMYEGMAIREWSDLSFSGGYPGLCLLFAELSEKFPDEGWDVIAHAHMQKISDAIKNEGIRGFSMFSGAAGIALAGLALSKGKTRYQKFMDSMNAHFVGELPKFLDKINERVGSIATEDFDVISGVSGIGFYLLQYKEQPKIKALLKNILHYLVRITEDITYEGIQIPGWYISPERFVVAAERERSPKGNFNLGLAHGIPGPLAFMAVAAIHNIEVAGQQVAIRKIAYWLDRWKLKDQNGGNFWGCTITFEDYINNNITDTHTREAWCYGTPGTARAIWLAGKALNDSYLLDLAIGAFEATLKRPQERWNISTGIICHGYGGLLHVLNLMYRDTGSKQIYEGQRMVLQEVLNRYNPESVFGYHNRRSREDNSLKDAVGFLEGATGIALTLLATIRPVKSKWDCALAIDY